MNNLEQAFAETEDTAATLLKTAQAMAAQAKRLQKAAKEGNIANLKKIHANLDQVMEDLGAAVAITQESWPYTDNEVLQYLDQGYVEELFEVAEEHDLAIHERDGQLIAYPSILSVVTSDGSVRIDRKKAPGVRPSSLVALLIKNQKKKPRFRPGTFLRALYGVYQELTREQGGRALIARETGRVVPLDLVYRMFTSMPGASRDYTRTDFARDIFELERSGEKVTRTGFEVFFPSSTGTRSGKGVFSFIGPDGSEASYYGMRFDKVDR
ncbi:MAG: hypothetical protein OXC13_13745 [Caldilineaceae bacterium]|nr:hypothetical protein [Caldilineaceae bacterium]